MSFEPLDYLRHILQEAARPTIQISRRAVASNLTLAPPRTHT